MTGSDSGAGARPEHPRSPGNVWWCAGIALAALGADVATKAWASARLSGGRDIISPGRLIHLQLVVNHGASLGFGSRYEPLIAAVTIAGVLLLGAWAARAASRTERVGAALAAAGAAGNLIDRLARAPGIFHGGVIDWIHLWFYAPTFNLADIWLRAGVLIAVAGWLWRARRANA